MRTYPENIIELEQKHNFSFPIDQAKLERIQIDIILRHDLVYVFLKYRILNAIKKQHIYEDEVFTNSFMDREFNQGDRIKIYKAFKNQLPLLFWDTGVLTIRTFICKIIGRNRNDIKAKFEVVFKDDIEKFKM